MNWTALLGAQRLTARDRSILIAGSILALGLCAHFFVLLPAKEKMSRLDAAIAQKQEAHRALVAMQHEYARMREGLRLAESRLLGAKAGTSLLAILEEVTGRLRVRGRIAHLRPQAEAVGEGLRETSAELKLEALRLDELLNLMAAIDDSPYWLRVRRFHLKARFSDPGLFDLSLLISTYAPAAQPARLSGDADHGR